MLEREKMSKQKPVKIMITPQIGGKKKAKPTITNRVSNVVNMIKPKKNIRRIPRQQPVRGYTGGMNAYGRNKSRNKKKKTKSKR